MEHSFRADLIKEGNKSYIKIPFNVWDVCGEKGLIPVKVSLNNVSFECKLIPKGTGIYYIPVTKAVLGKLHSEQDLSVLLRVIASLSRINNNSPYSKKNPIRKIDSIKSIIQPKAGLCGQICIAMLAGTTVEKVIQVMSSGAWQISMGKMLETLDYYGIGYGDKMIYTRVKDVKLPVCCILNERTETCNHFLLFYKGKYFDSVLGELDEYDLSNMIGYLEIITE